MNPKKDEEGEVAGFSDDGSGAVEKAKAAGDERCLLHCTRSVSHEDVTSVEIVGELLCWQLSFVRAMCDPASLKIE